MKSKNVKMSILFLLLILLTFFSVFIFKINLLDSDSGREFNAALNLEFNKFDGGPIITPSLYRIISLLIGYADTLIIFKIINLFAFLVLIFFGIKLLDNSGRFKIEIFIFFILLLSTISIFLLPFYFKPYLFTIMFVVLGIYYLINSEFKKNKYTYIIVGSIFLSFAAIGKNHAYPILVMPFLFFLIFSQRDKLKQTIISTIPHLFILFPIIVMGIIKFGSKFWHYPNTWYYEEGFNYFIANIFWHYPKKFSLEYFYGQYDFLIFTFPLAVIAILALNYMNNNYKIKLIGIIVILSASPFLISVMPFYFIYNYIIVFFLVLMVVLFFETSKSYFKKNIILLSLFSIMCLSFLLISSNIVYVNNLSKKTNDQLVDFKKFEKTIDTNNQINAYIRDYKFQPYTTKFDFVIFDNTEKKILIPLLDSENKSFEITLKNNNITYLFFYNNSVYNEDFYNTLLMPLNKSFNMDKYYMSRNLTLVYNSSFLIVFKIKNDSEP